ncbi:MAG: PIN domain-containing protein [Gaiellales bacterium]
MVDTSVWTWATRVPAVRGVLRELTEHDHLATCRPVFLEMLHSARSLVEFAEIRSTLEGLIVIPTDERVWRRAVDVYELLAAQGGMHQRQVQHADLLIAAAAEVTGIPVLHYDEDYDRIAAVTGQPTEWVRPRGSL